MYAKGDVYTVALSPAYFEKVEKLYNYYYICIDSFPLHRE